MKVADVLKQKPPGVETIEDTASLSSATERFVRTPVRCLVVTRDQRLVGMLTVRDLLRNVHATGGTLTRAVSDAMSKDIASATPDTSLEEVQHLIVSRRINHVPVLDGDQLVGVVTLADVLRVHVDDVSTLNSELRRYLHSPYVL